MADVTDMYGDAASDSYMYLLEDGALLTPDVTGGIGVSGTVLLAV